MESLPPPRPAPAHTTTHPYLTPLLLKTLRITTKDGRIFVGTFKCTDRDLNLILSDTSEFRPPPPSAISDVLSASVTSNGGGIARSTRKNSTPSSEAYINHIVAIKRARAASVTVTIKSRFLGLVCVPGGEVVKVEVEGY